MVEDMVEDVVDDPLYIELPEATVDWGSFTESNERQVCVKGIRIREDRATQTKVKMVHVGAQTDDAITGVSCGIVLSYKEQIKLLKEMLVVNT